MIKMDSIRSRSFWRGQKTSIWENKKNTHTKIGKMGRQFASLKTKDG